MGKVEALRRECEARIGRWLAEVDRADGREWVTLGSADELPPEVRADSQYWCDLLLAAAANPYDAADTVHAYHLATADTPDLVKHEFTSGGRRMRVIEGCNFLVLEPAQAHFDLRALAPASRAETIAALSRAVLRAPPAEQCFPGEIGEEASFCSDESADPLLLGDASARCDGVVRDGSVRLLCYKKPSQIVGFASPNAWFDEAFRERR